MTSIEITSIRDRKVQPIRTSRCVVSRGCEPCGSDAVHAIALGGRLAPICLRDLAKATDLGAVALFDGSAR